MSGEEQSSAPPRSGSYAAPATWRDRILVPALIFAVCAAIYVLVLGDRRSHPTPNNHYVYLADSLLHGQLGVRDNKPPGYNDWACFDTQDKDSCPAGRYDFRGQDAERYRWYVSFPPFPAAVIAPLVAIMGTSTPDALFWALIAALAPTFLYGLLRKLREAGRSDRKVWEDLVLVALYAFGSVFFFVAVQGTVWFAAHVVASSLIVLFLRASLGARRPVAAGIALGLLFLTRPTTLPLAIFFATEALAQDREESRPGTFSYGWTQALHWLSSAKWKQAIARMVWFAVPIAVCGALAMWFNYARFNDPFEFGHRYLQIAWRGRIEKWGLFNYHYLAKNLSVFWAGLPWISSDGIKISGHGLALWFTTPNLLLVLWPKRLSPTTVGLYFAAFAIATWNLLYQNSGWVQFGYRFALDYMPVLIVLLALGRRKMGPGFLLAAIFAIVVNTFGALTFDRAPDYYDNDGTQERLFQPD